MTDFLSEYLYFALKAIAFGYVIVALSKAISLHLIQIQLIRKHGLPMSGFKWGMFVPNFLRTFFQFLIHFQTSYISCKLDGDKGGFIWTGVFKWKVW